MAGQKNNYNSSSNDDDSIEKKLVRKSILKIPFFALCVLLIVVRILARMTFAIESKLHERNAHFVVRRFFSRRSYYVGFFFVFILNGSKIVY